MKDMESVVCACKKSINFFELVVYQGVPYHEHCLRFKLAGELAKYDKKFQTGDLSIKDDHLRKELQFEYDLLRKKSTPTHSKKDPYRFCQKPGFGFLESSNVGYFPGPEGKQVCGDYIGLPLMRTECFKSVQKQKFKELEASRSERWAWEFFNDVSELKLIENENDKLPTFPLENSMKIGVKNQNRPIAILISPKCDSGRQVRIGENESS